MLTKPNKTRKLITAAVFAALILVTTLIKIPVPSMTEGYVNLGDCFVLLAGLLLGPLWGGLAAAVGSALSDLILGYPIYAPATFLIKWLMALTAFYLCRLLSKTKIPLTLNSVISAVAGEAVMIGGYFLYELPLYGAAAVASIFGNTVQAVFGAVAAVILYVIIRSNKQLRNLTGGFYDSKK